MTLPRLLKLSLVPALIFIAHQAARAQVSIYLAPALTAYAAGTGSSFGFKTNTGGFAAGGFYNFPIRSRLTAGIDLRTVLSPGTNGGDFTGVGLRIGLVPHRIPLRPYFQIGGGVVTTTVQNYSIVFSGTVVTNITTQRLTSGAAELTFGLDIRLTEHFDLRLIDYGAAAGASSTSSAAMAFLDTGVVYHFRPRTP